MEILVTEKIDKDLLGVFANSFYLSNYEFTHKTAPPTKEDDKASEEEKDERLKKFTKKIEKFNIDHPLLKELESSQDYKVWLTSAKATELARNLANTRGSVATPDYMEEQARKIAEDKKGVKEFRVVRGQELVD